MTAIWERHGECNQCGWCCEKIARDVLVRTPEQVSRDAAYYAARGFTPVQLDGETRHVLWVWAEARCPELRTKAEQWSYGVIEKHSCAIHDQKPQTCVDYPRIPQDIAGTPCSYWFTSGDKAVGGTGSPHPVDALGLLALEGAA